MPQLLLHALQIIKILNVHGLITNVMLKLVKYTMDQLLQYVTHRIVNAHQMDTDVKISKFVHNIPHKFHAFRVWMVYVYGIMDAINLILAMTSY